jgi:predicted nuclease of restriction endonuclease-like (RecB) superfamily
MADKPSPSSVTAPSAIGPSPAGYGDWLAKLKVEIRQAQSRALFSVNAEMIRLYWRIGRDILERQGQQGWGASVIPRLSADLRVAFPDVKGFSPKNLGYMKAFAEAWPSEDILQTVSAKLPWSHQIALLDKLDGQADHLWYAQAAIEHGWSARVLAHQIDTRLHERDGRSMNNFTATSRLCRPRLPGNYPSGMSSEQGWKLSWQVTMGRKTSRPSDLLSVLVGHQARGRCLPSHLLS